MMAELQQEGKVASIGVSNVDVDELAEALNVTQIVSVQNEYNVLERSSEDVLKVCEERGLAFLSYYPLASGDLAGRKPPRVMAKIASRHHAPPAQIALAWLLHHSRVIRPIPGTMSLAHLEENVAAARVRLDGEDLASLDALAG